MHRTASASLVWWLRSSLLAMIVVLSPALFGQAGPNSPSTAVNNTASGGNAWNNPLNALTSNNTYSSVTSRGATHLLQTTGFGFSIPSPAAILGIKLDVERSVEGAQDVALLDAWTTGLTRTVSAGSDRCLVVAYCQENGINSRDLTAVTYGGRSMTQVVEVAAGNSGGFHARLEVWILLDAEISLAASTTIVPTFGSYTDHEYCDAFSSAVFRNVDQLSPVVSQQTSGAQASANPHQLSASIGTLDGSMAVNLATCGNNTTPATTDGGTNTYDINSGYTEGTDLYFANTTSAPSTGACFQTAHKAITTSGSEQPSCTFAGTVNRWAMIGFVLQRVADTDREIRLVKGGAVTGSNLASTAAWPSSDAVATYGGSTSLWGSTWTVADINSTGFGAAVAAQVRNGTVKVDHMTLTVYWSSTLPIELLDFRAVANDQRIDLKWITATEADNDHFSVMRSANGIDFKEVARVQGAGNSNTTLFYHAIDAEPLPGTSYYRLDQVDHDGTSTASTVVAVEMPMAAGDPIVHPNPSSDGVFTIAGLDPSDDQVMVLTSDLRLLRTHIGTAQDPVVHLHDLPDGTYVLMFRSGGQLRTARVMKASGQR